MYTVGCQLEVRKLLFFFIRLVFSRESVRLIYGRRSFLDLNGWLILQTDLKLFFLTDSSFRISEVHIPAGGTHGP